MSHHIDRAFENVQILFLEKSFLEYVESGIKTGMVARGKSPAPLRATSGKSSKGKTPAKKSARMSSRSKTPPATRSKSKGRRANSPAPAAAARGGLAAREARRADREEIESLVLWKRPLDTLYHFGIVFVAFLASPVHAAMDRKNILVVGPIVMAMMALFIARLVEGPHLAPLQRLEHQFWYSMWWFGLGVASSVGLGTGAHTGTLFLFPHICAVVRTAENHKELDFDPTHNMFKIPPTLVRSMIAVIAEHLSHVASASDAFRFLSDMFLHAHAARARVPTCLPLLSFSRAFAHVLVLSHSLSLSRARYLSLFRLALALFPQCCRLNLSRSCLRQLARLLFQHSGTCSLSSCFRYTNMYKQ